MDSRQSRSSSKRPSSETASADNCPPIRYFSCTIPGTSGAIPHSRSLSLSSQVKDYYEKLVNNSKSQKTSLPSDQGFNTEFRHSFGGETGKNHHYTSITSSACSDRRHPTSSQQKSEQRETQNQPTQPYSTIIRGFGTSEPYSRRKTSPLLSPVYATSHSPPYFNKGEQDTMSSSKSRRSRSKSPLNTHDFGQSRCILCQDSYHSPRACPIRNRSLDDEETGALSQRTRVQSSMKTFSEGRYGKCGSDFHDVSDSNPIVAQRQALLPSSSTGRCERDVIGQERSPVSKIRPSISGVLSTSSSNGDSVPRERKKWVRPPLVGQAASSSDQPLLINSSVFDRTEDDMCLMEKKRPAIQPSELSSSTGSEQAESKSGSYGSSQQKNSYDSKNERAKRLAECRDEYLREKDRDENSSAFVNQPHVSESDQGLSDSCPGGRVSPSSSVTSSRRLEWDSGADVGYNQDYHVTGLESEALEVSELCAIKRMALSEGCSVALRLRLDPEGTTVPVPATGTAVPLPVLPSPVQDMNMQRAIGLPSAESTPFDRVLQVGGLSRRRNESYLGISPIFPTSQYQDFNKEFRRQSVSRHVPLVEEDDEEQEEVEKEPLIHPVSRQLSHSMQDLSNQNNESKDELCRSRSDPDLSAADVSTFVSTCARFKSHAEEILKSQHLIGSMVAVHSASSGSDATLVHIEQDEQDQTESNRAHTRSMVINEVITVPNEALMERNEGEKKSSPVQQVASAVQKIPKEQASSKCQGSDQAEECEETKISDRQNREPTPSMQQGVANVRGQVSQPSHLCSDKDHKKGLHHHFGVLCATAVGGQMTCTMQPGISSQSQRLNVDRMNTTEENQEYNQDRKSQIREPASSAGMVECEVLTAESAASSAFLSDTANGDCAANGNTLLMTGRANSFEYLPGHMYQSRSAGRMKKVNLGPPGISTSTETDSEPLRSVSQALHHSLTDSSSRETEEDRLWGSPRPGSNSVVRDLERGISLLKGLMEDKSSSRRCKREVIRRVIRRLVTSDYVEDLVDRNKSKICSRSPFSPRRAKQSEWQERLLRSKRGIGPNRPEVFEKTEEQRKHTHNIRKKLHDSPLASTSQAQRTKNMYTDCKSSSLSSSQAESTNGSLSLSGASEPPNKDKHKNDPSSKVNPFPVTGRERSRSDWMEPATKSERVLAMRMQSGDNKSPTSEPSVEPEKQGAPLAFQTPVGGFLQAEHSKQLLWVKNEINHLKILKQLLQKQETLGKNVEPHPLYHSAYTVMPVITTQDKHSMRMADCALPDVAEELSPTTSKSPWKNLESDTSDPSDPNARHNSCWHVELTSTHEIDVHRHQSVNISDADHGTDDSVSEEKGDECSNAHMEMTPSVKHQPKSKNEFVRPTDRISQKPRTDCVCGNKKGQSANHMAAPSDTNESRVSDKKVVHDKQMPRQICVECQKAGHQGHVPKMEHSFMGKRNSASLSSHQDGQVQTHSGSRDSSQRKSSVGDLTQRTQSVHPCVCGPAEAQNPCICGPAKAETVSDRDGSLRHSRTDSGSRGSSQRKSLVGNLTQRAQSVHQCVCGPKQTQTIDDQGGSLSRQSQTDSASRDSSQRKNLVDNLTERAQSVQRCICGPKQAQTIDDQDGSLSRQSQTDSASRDSSQRKSLVDNLTQRAQSIHQCICGPKQAQTIDDQDGSLSRQSRTDSASRDSSQRKSLVDNLTQRAQSVQQCICGLKQAQTIDDNDGNLLRQSRTDPSSRDSSQRKGLVDNLTQRAQSVHPCTCGPVQAQTVDDHDGSLRESQTDSGSRDSSQTNSLVENLTQRAQSAHPCICGPKHPQTMDDVHQSSGAPEVVVRSCAPQFEDYQLFQSSQSSTGNKEYGSRYHRNGSVAFDERFMDSHTACGGSAIAGRRYDSIPDAEVNNPYIPRSASDDSVTKAVTKAVTSKVRALKNMGPIEEAEVKIRVKMGQGPGDASGKVWKSQDSDDDQTSLSSKQAEINDLLARQMALDSETRQKLLTIAESRRRAGAHSNQCDVDRHIQDLLLQDYLSRHPLKTHEEALNVPQVNMPRHGRKDNWTTTTDQAKNTKGTSTTPSRNSHASYFEQPTMNCECDRTVGRQTEFIVPEFVADAPPLPSTVPLPSVCTCSCRSSIVNQPTLVPPVCSCNCTDESHRIQSAFSCPPRTLLSGRHVGFQQKSNYLSNQGHCCCDVNVHETLKKRNTAYFLQFAEEESTKPEEKEESKKHPLDVVTVKIPKKKSNTKKPPVSIPKQPFQQGSSVSSSQDFSNLPPARKSTQEEPNFNVRSHELKITDEERCACACTTMTADTSNSNKIPSVERCACACTTVKTDTSHANKAPLVEACTCACTTTTADTSNSNKVPPAEICTTNKIKGQAPVTTSNGTESHSESVKSYNLNQLHKNSSLPAGISVQVEQFSSTRSHHYHTADESKGKKVPRRNASVTTRCEGADTSVFSGRPDLSGNQRRKKSSGKVFKTMAFYTGSGGSMSSAASGASNTLEKEREKHSDLFESSTSDRDSEKMPSLQEYLQKNYPGYLDAAETRRQCIVEMSYLRKLRHQSRKRLLELEGDSWKARHRQQRRYGLRPKLAQKKRMSPKSMKLGAKQKYGNLPEVQQRKADLKRKEENRTNRLMAEIYTRKLQEKVLKGSTTLPSSVSVISTL